MEDPALAGLTLIDVAPAPDTTRLRIVLAADVVDAAQRAAATRVLPRLRAAIANQTARKRVPELAVVVVPSASAPSGGGS